MHVTIEPMELIELCQGLLDALEQFDNDVLPLGLYASDELVEGKKLKPRYQEWQGAILPYLKSQGCSTTGYSTKSQHASGLSVQVPSIGPIAISVVKFSNIKVRKYGSGYHVDKHEERSQRWEQVDLSGHISHLWKQPGALTEGFRLQAQVLVFIGFDKSQRPLERELAALQQSLKWETKEVIYITRSWPDKAGRGFGVRLSAWARPVSR